jgi:septal ring factor EnvC (AmiA/AmiB activator)
MNPKLTISLATIAAVVGIAVSAYGAVSFLTNLDHRQATTSEKLAKNEVKIEKIEQQISDRDARLIRIETKVEGISDTLSEIKDELKK